MAGDHRLSCTRETAQIREVSEWYLAAPEPGDGTSLHAIGSNDDKGRENGGSCLVTGGLSLLGGHLRRLLEVRFCFVSLTMRDMHAGLRVRSLRKVRAPVL